MRNRMPVLGQIVRYIFFATVAIYLCAVTNPRALRAQEAAPPAPAAASEAVAPAPPAPEAAAPKVDTQTPADAASGQKGMVSQEITVMMMIRWGGAILWFTMFLGFIAFVMAVYFLLTVNTKREVPPVFVRRVLTQLRSGDLRGAYQLCENRDELLARVVRAGLKMSGHDRYVIQEAMESEGERGVTALWQKISYLNNIGVIAPLLGLLGTVWGMVLAFSSIASDNTQVRGMVVAENVSKALITTVGGLIVAIPCMGIYFFLRGRVVKIIAEVEATASEVIELLAKGRES